MSILQTSKVWALETLEPFEKLVLLAVADFADDSGKAWPSIRTIARKSSLSVDTVRRKIRKLTTEGILSMTPRKDQAGRDTSYNFQLFPDTSSKVLLFPDTSPNFSRLKGSTMQGGEGSTMQEGGVHHARGEGSTMQPSSMKHQSEPSKTYSEFFETLWEDYPLRDGKKKAFAHFRATVKSEADCQRIRKALDNYLAHLCLSDWKHPKNGSNWFNNWQDWENSEKTNTAKPSLTEPRLLQVVL